MKKLTILFFLLNIILYSQANPDINLIQEKFDSIKDFTADFEQTISAVSQSTVIKGKILYKRENKLRIEVKNQSVISDGITTWNYNTNSNQVIISNVEDDPSTFSLSKIIYEYPALCSIINKGKEMVNGVELTKLELKPNTPELNFSFAALWFDDDFLVRKLQIAEGSGSIFIVNLSGYKLNNGLTDSRFTFSPPKGSQVIDLR